VLDAALKGVAGRCEEGFWDLLYLLIIILADLSP
jgi:hypothetical protein